MFNFLKRKKNNQSIELSDSELQFIKTVAEKLYQEFPQFLKQVEAGVFCGVTKNPGGSLGSYIYLLDSITWEKLSDKTVYNFDVKNIAYKTKSGEKGLVDLFISENLIIGYKIYSFTIPDILLSTIDVSNIYIKTFLNDDFKGIEPFIKKLTHKQLQKFNLVKNTYEISIDGVKYYPLISLDNGDLVAISLNGEIFQIIHDPLQIEKVSDNISDFVNTLQ
ncbi:MAG: hypothetical protein SFU21_10930 [Flavihumibacter sp.]|nr:hypothetical protein [Flavihumibacter sp.]